MVKPEAGAGVVVETCDASSTNQQFNLPGKGDQVSVESESGDLCLDYVAAGTEGGLTVQLTPCTTKNADAYTFGASGRMCKTDGCLSVTTN